MAKQIVCPACGQADQVEKVSTLYLLGIGLKPPLSTGEAAPAVDTTGISFASRDLSRKLAPPATSKQAPTRPLHPDMVVLTFSLIMPVLLYGVYTSQTVLLLPLLVVLAIAYGLYFWKRISILAKYERLQAERQAKEERIQRGVGRWMKLYYCARDDGIFEPGSDELIPVDFLPGYLVSE